LITLTSNQLALWLAQLFWPFVRIGACLMVAPAFATQSVPPQIRIVLAGAIALLVAPLAPAPAQVTPFSFAGAMITLQQLVIGARSTSTRSTARRHPRSASSTWCW